VSQLPYRHELGWAANALTVAGAVLGILAFLELRRRRLAGHFDNGPMSKASLLGGLL